MLRISQLHSILTTNTKILPSIELLQLSW